MTSSPDLVAVSHRSSCYRFHIEVILVLAEFCSSQLHMASNVAPAQGSHSPFACFKSRLFYILNDL